MRYAVSRGYSRGIGKEKDNSLFIYAYNIVLADEAKPTDPLEKKPVHRIISIVYFLFFFTLVYGRGKRIFLCWEISRAGPVSYTRWQA